MGSGRSTNETAGVAIGCEECAHRSATKPYKLCVKTKRLHLIWLRVSAVASFISSAFIGSLIRTSRYTHTDSHEWTHQIKTPPDWNSGDNLHLAGLNRRVWTYWTIIMWRALCTCVDSAHQAFSVEEGFLRRPIKSLPQPNRLSQ